MWNIIITSVLAAMISLHVFRWRLQKWIESAYKK